MRCGAIFFAPRTSLSITILYSKLESCTDCILNDFKGYIPIKIKTYNDKIWYLKDGVITNEISSETDEISNVKTIELKEYIYFQFLNDKIIIKEHIFNNRTNIEEELLNEMKQLSNVGIELKENEQNSLIPHEVINELDIL